MFRIDADPTLVEPIAPDDHVLGPPGSPVEVVEYGDFECPYTRRAHAAVEALRERMGDRFRFAFRHFPQREIHPHAQALAEAAEAAASQGRFWEMRELLWRAFDAFEWSDLMGHAEQLGLDLVQFEADLDDHRFATRVSHHEQTGIESGVRGTPTFFIAGVRHDRRDALDMAFLGRRIEQAAARAAGLPWPPREHPEHR